MTTLPLSEAIYRFRENDERVDVLINGDENDTFTTSEGVVVPSAQKFMKDTAADVVDLRDRLLTYVSYSIVIESTAGTAFRLGEARSTTLNARVFSNGTEVTTDIAASRFRWRRVSAVDRAYPNDDATWNSIFLSGYRSVSVNVDDVYARATFFCEINDS